jgi:RimJ/RimL family protein N-acetyltransferase
VGLGKGDETAWRSAWGGTAATANTHQASRSGLPLDLRPEGPLVGRIVRAEPLEERHREGLRAAAAEDPAIWRYTSFGGDFDVWFDEALGSTTDVPFAVVVGGVEVGSMRFLNIVPEHRRAEIGWSWLRPSSQGTGANAETKFLLLERAFDACRLQRVEFKTDARNERARGGLESIGGRFEGIFRKHMLLPTGPRDSAWYAITEDDWPEAKEALRQRIARFA